MSFGCVCVCALNVYRAVWAIVNLVWDPLFSLIPFWLAAGGYIFPFLAVQFSTWKCSRCFPTRKDNRELYRLYTKIPSSQKVRRRKGKKKKKQELCAGMEFLARRLIHHQQLMEPLTLGFSNSILTGHKRPFFLLLLLLPPAVDIRRVCLHKY